MTNLSWDEEDIYHFYDKRADVENHVREGKHDFFIGHLSTGDFHANAADLELRLLALNQMVLFTKNILKQHSPRHFASTVRREVAFDTGKIDSAWWPVNFETLQLVSLPGYVACVSRKSCRNIVY